MGGSSIFWLLGTKGPSYVRSSGLRDRRNPPIFVFRTRRSKNPHIFVLRPRRSKKFPPSSFFGHEDRRTPIFVLRPRRLGRRSPSAPRWTGRFAQGATIFRALEGIEDKCLESLFESTNIRNPLYQRSPFLAAAQWADAYVFVLGYGLHEEGLQRPVGVGTLVSSQERRAHVVPRINRKYTADQPVIVFFHRFT